MLSGKTVLLQSTDLLLENPGLFRGATLVSELEDGGDEDHLAQISDFCGIRGLIHCLARHPQPSHDTLVVDEWPDPMPRKQVICGDQVFCPECKTRTRISDSQDSCCATRVIRAFSAQAFPAPPAPRAPTRSLKSDEKALRSAEKFQKSVEKDALRLEFTMKREMYKKEMRQPSLRKKISSTAVKKLPESGGVCAGLTRKGVPCTNRALGSSRFCGIASHSG